MAMQRKLDKSKPYGYIVGDAPNGATFTQNNIDFSSNGDRITPFTDAEKQAVKDAAQAIKDMEKADADKDKAINKAVNAMQKKVDAAKDAKVKGANYPEGIDKWNRNELLNYSRNKFHVGLSGNANQIRVKIKDLLNEG